MHDDIRRNTRRLAQIHWESGRYDQAQQVIDAGPINVWSFDPVKRTFEREFIVDEEAIELFHVIDGDLYIPASDPARVIAISYRRRGGRVETIWRTSGSGPNVAAWPTIRENWSAWELPSKRDRDFHFGLGCESDDKVAHACALLGYKIEDKD